MKYPGFIGGGYLSRSRNAAADRLVNLMVEPMESGTGVNVAALYCRPGLAQFAEAPGGPWRALFSMNNRTFGVAGRFFYEILGADSLVERGELSTATGPASIYSNGANGHQLFIVAGVLGYIFATDTNTFTQITSPGFVGAVAGGYIDGYFLALHPDRVTIGWSALNDGLSWDAGDVIQRLSSADPLTTILVSNHLIWRVGTQTTDALYDAGGDPPFVPINESLMQMGGFRDSMLDLDNTLLGIGQNIAGQGMAWRGNGYIPQRISNHAVETAWQRYSKISDVIAMRLQLDGHGLAVFTFPTAGRTWVYDVSAPPGAAWSEWDYWNADAGLSEAFRGIVHCQSPFGHLIGDRESGILWQARFDVLKDGDNVLRRVRQAPHIQSEQRWIFYDQFQLYLEAGLGLTEGQGSDPQVALSWSNDGGHVFSPEIWQSAGKIGTYRHRAMWRHLGKARDRVFRVAMSDPTPSRWIDAYLDVTPGTS